jgi:hypothetical protein
MLIRHPSTIAWQLPKQPRPRRNQKVKGAPQYQRRSFTPKKPSFAAPTQGLEHIIFDNTGTAKVASTFNLNIEAISEHITNRLKFDGPLAALAVRELKALTINFPNNPTDPTNLVETTKLQRNLNHAHDQQKWWDENTQNIYNLVMQHSTPEMKTKLLTMDLWAKTSAARSATFVTRRMAVPTPRPSSILSKWTRTCSLSTKLQPSPY